MIDIQELRIGSLIYSKTDPTKNIYSPMQVTAISDNGTLDTKNSKQNCSNVSVQDINPLPITNPVIKVMVAHNLIHIIPGRKNFYYFPGKSQTYFLVYDKNGKNFYMGMADADEPTKPRRVSRPFTEYHKLQNAYRMVFDQEMKLAGF